MGFIYQRPTYGEKMLGSNFIKRFYKNNTNLYFFIIKIFSYTVTFYGSAHADTRERIRKRYEEKEKRGFDGVSSMSVVNIPPY